MSSHARGALLVVSAALCWSSGGLIARIAHTDAWTTVFWRSVFCAAFLVAVVVAASCREPLAPFRAMGWAGVAMAACFATASTCFIMALTRTSVANVLIMQSLSPFIAGLLGWMWMGERVPLRTWLAMAAALAGTAIMVSGSARRSGLSLLTGDLLALAMAMAFAAATVVVRRQREVRMSAAAALAAVFGALVALPQAAPMAAAPRDVLLLALFGAGQLGLGLLLFTAGARLIPVAEASLIAVLESVLGPVWVWLAIGERPGRPTLLGGGVALAALIAHTVADLRHGRAARGGSAAPDAAGAAPAGADSPGR